MPRLITAACSCVVAAVLLACAGTARDSFKQDLAGSWKIRAGECRDCADPALDDSAWDRLSLPGSLLPYSLGATGTAGGTAWLRTTVRLPGPVPADGVGLLLDRAGNADEAWVNGVFVGSTGSFPPKAMSQWNRPRQYFIPAALLRPGQDTLIALRVSHGIYSEVGPVMRLCDRVSLDRARAKASLLLGLNYAVSASCGALGLVFLLMYLRRPAWKEYLFFILQLLPGFFVVYDSWGPWPLPGGAVDRVRLLGFAWTALVVVHLGFLHRIYGLRRPAVERALWCVLALDTAILLLVKDITADRHWGFVVILTVMPLALYNISIHVRRLAAGHPYAKFLVVPGVVLSLSAVHDGLAYLPRLGGPAVSVGGYGFDAVTFGYAAAMMFVGGALILAHRFMAALEEADGLNARLEARVRERTRELEKSLAEMTELVRNTYIDQRIRSKGGFAKNVTPAAEEKIRAAIVYINENYTEDISREGLAASLDMNPDYLGRTFMVYTGKKIGDYINELRVKKALVLMNETDRTLLDIAFAVGFESVRTFNRAFSRVMKTLPGSYRRAGGAKPPDG